jgi:hypothetical protein
MDKQLPLSCLFIKVFDNFKSQVKNKYQMKSLETCADVEYSYMGVLKYLAVVLKILCCSFSNSFLCLLALCELSMRLC